MQWRYWFRKEKDVACCRRTHWLKFTTGRRCGGSATGNSCFMLALGVVIPTKNSMAYLPRHVAGLQPWLELAAEVVVVDSHSTDGTVGFLRANLRHPALRFTDHPPGLYASWNHGVAEISSKYVFIATTGDTITREGVCQLVEAAESLGCDVVISKPTFCDAAGRR